MHFIIFTVFATIITTVICSLFPSLSNLTNTQTSSNTNTIELEQFTYEVVIPQPLRSLKTFFDHANKTLYYRIRAFNQTFDLSLIEDEIFLTPSFVIQHFDQNRTWLTKDIEHCFYKGYVNRNPLSTISINLCNGLLGTFVYNGTEYFIEPKYHESDSKWSFEHLFYTYKDSVLSIKDHDQEVRYPVDGKSYFEKQNPFRQRLRRDKNQDFFELSDSNLNYVENDLAYHVKRRAKRQLDFDPVAKHVEVLVAYDESIKEFHSGAGIKSYILTLFSYVSHLYSDATIGNNIKIWLVKLVDLGKNNSEYILSSNDDAPDILSRFCLWQRRNYQPNVADAAILLTRKSLCNKQSENVTNSECDTLSSSKIGDMCNEASKCAVVRNNGFATSFTIAHEIARLIGIPYDNDNACLEHTKEQNIMASSLTFTHNHHIWSNCSRHYFTQYLESDRYLCLNNIPDSRSTSFRDLNAEQQAREMPGRFSDLNDQCRRIFGVTFRYCIELSHNPKCFRLYCREKLFNLTSCLTNHAHWSDGTLCSEPRTEIKRCFHGECKSTQQLQIINGNWGEWSSWTPCTRTCGSAIQKSQRFCDNPKPENGGHYCSGKSTRIRSCEDNQPCENSDDIFRQRQCSEFNNRTVDLLLPVGVRFEPKYNVSSKEKCKLICKVSGNLSERTFTLRDNVEDGTPCEREGETRDICISGVCIPIGCDHKYGSNATEDVCGICNGQNQTCRSVKKQTMVSDFGITNVIDIPINATFVRVTQISAGNDRYYLAVKHMNGTYVLNGMHSLQLSSVRIRIGEASLTYTGSDSGNETVSISGRLKVPLKIQVISIYQDRAPATLVDWEYYSPFDDVNLERQHGNESYNFHCDRPCQGYKQVPKCLIDRKERDLSSCSTNKMPLIYEKERCNDDCVLNWTMRYEQACSTRCGAGHKRMTYECTKTSSTKQTAILMSGDICRKYVGEKPKDVVSCVGDCTGTGWVYEDWGECHFDGGCVRKRSTECRNASDMSTVSNYCVLEFISDTEPCAKASCDQSRWNFTSWSDCDCVSQQRQRKVKCMRLGKQVNNRDCIKDSKPDETISCYDECRTAHWETHKWQPCRATCSSPKGIRRRRIVCSHLGSIVRDDYCDRRLKPIEQKWCSTKIRCSTWSINEWSPCSVTYGTGIQQRSVQCTKGGRSMDKSNCPQPMPPEQQTCTFLKVDA